MEFLLDCGDSGHGGRLQQHRYPARNAGVSRESLGHRRACRRSAIPGQSRQRAPNLIGLSCRFPENRLASRQGPLAPASQKASDRRALPALGRLHRDLDNPGGSRKSILTLCRGICTPLGAFPGRTPRVSIGTNGLISSSRIPEWDRYRPGNTLPQSDAECPAKCHLNAL